MKVRDHCQQHEARPAIGSRRRKSLVVGSAILQNSRRVFISKVLRAPLMPKIIREMVYIDAGGRLYRGFGRCYPAIVWHQEEARWTVCELPTPQDWDWGGLVTVREAERCYPGSTTAQAPEGVETAADLSGEELIRFRPELF